MFRWVLCALFFGACVCSGEREIKEVKPQSISRGWGNGISWVKNYEEGLSKMVKSQKPLMVIHHQNGCPFSQEPAPFSNLKSKLKRSILTELKKVFSTEKSIQKMAKEDFIMLNLLEETGDENLAPDGYYVPRILFVDPSMTVRTDITGKYSNRLYTYEPGDMAYLAMNMRKAQKLVYTEL